jgi:hypothetical protein
MLYIRIDYIRIQFSPRGEKRKGKGLSCWSARFCKAVATFRPAIDESTRI